ncbi:hypothetical protein BO99DRAFT_6547 [Aspergillus violaceofuscus CBS 115571]|uniref:Uncharacterized protein n=1 Tax=Aspergillus violaceofuscus (strain CBS 115571) TaxID=1450538 RepID=A0A2V5IRC0_ASPV1|nr:hypothetical protein BO99DRAFT_6547 [Aspergillus violaceofuscus CBS 115571]
MIPCGDHPSSIIHHRHITTFTSFYISSFCLSFFLSSLLQVFCPLLPPSLSLSLCQSSINLSHLFILPVSSSPLSSTTYSYRSIDLISCFGGKLTRAGTVPTATAGKLTGLEFSPSSAHLTTTIHHGSMSSPLSFCLSSSLSPLHLNLSVSLLFSFFRRGIIFHPLPPSFSFSSLTLSPFPSLACCSSVSFPSFLSIEFVIDLVHWICVSLPPAAAVTLIPPPPPPLLLLLDPNFSSLG